MHSYKKVLNVNLILPLLILLFLLFFFTFLRHFQKEHDDNSDEAKGKE